jgi:Subtilase family
METPFRSSIQGALFSIVLLATGSVLTLCGAALGASLEAGGEAAEPAFEFAAYAFTAGPSEARASLQPVRFNNPGSAPRTITNIRTLTDAEPSPFQILNRVKLPAQVAPGGSLKLFDVHFVPRAAGTVHAEVELTLKAPTPLTRRARLEGVGLSLQASFYTDPRSYRLEFDKLKYSSGDPIWVRFADPSVTPVKSAEIYLVAPQRGDVERLTLTKGSVRFRSYNQVERIVATHDDSARFDGRLSAGPGDYMFVVYQAPGKPKDIHGTTLDFAFMKGGQAQGLFTLDVDEAMAPRPASVQGRPGEAPRTLASITDTSNYPVVFGDDQIIIEPENLTELNDFLQRYHGVVVDDGRRRKTSHRKRHYYLVRVDLARADLEDFAFTAELAGMKGRLRTSSNRTRRLYSIVANEQLEGRRVTINPRVELFDQPRTAEDANLDGAGSADALQLEFIRDCMQKVNRAWMYVAMHDRDRANGVTVPLAVIDDGFCVENADLVLAPAMGFDVAEDDANPFGPRITPIGDNWHGNNTASETGSLLNNGIGVAGSGGQVADMLLYRLGLYGHVFEVGTAIDLAVADGARVINMSLGYPCRPLGLPSLCDFGTLWFCPFLNVAMVRAAEILSEFVPVPPLGLCEPLVFALAPARMMMEAAVEDAIDAGVVLVASAGNGRDNVDPADVSDFEVIPAVLPDVIAVGAIDTNYNNTEFFGDRVDVWAIAPTRTFEPPQAGSCAGVFVTDDFGQTSSAAGFVSGVAAMMLAVNPNLTPQDIRRIFHLFARSPNDDRAQRILDAYAAVRTAGTRAGLPDLQLRSPSLGFDEGLPLGVACPNDNAIDGIWPPALNGVDELLGGANELPLGVGAFPDRAIHNFTLAGGPEQDRYFFHVPTPLAENVVFELELTTVSPTVAGVVVPDRIDAVSPDPGVAIVDGVQDLPDHSSATWHCSRLFLRDDIFFNVRGISAAIANRDNVYTLDSNIGIAAIDPDRYDLERLGIPRNDSIDTATTLPNLPADVFEVREVVRRGRPGRLWTMRVPNLNFETRTDVDFFRLDLPDEAGDDCGFVCEACPELFSNTRGELSLSVVPTISEETCPGGIRIRAHNPDGTVRGNNDDRPHDLFYGAPRCEGFDTVYFSVTGNARRSEAYEIVVEYFVPDTDQPDRLGWARLCELCGAFQEDGPRDDPGPAPDQPDGNDGFALIDPETLDLQEFVFGRICNPIVCTPAYQEWYVFERKASKPFSVVLKHAAGQAFDLQLVDRKLGVVARGVEDTGSRPAARGEGGAITGRRIDRTLLPAGVYLLRVASKDYGARYTVHFIDRR